MCCISFASINFTCFAILNQFISSGQNSAILKDTRPNSRGVTDLTLMWTIFHAISRNQASTSRLTLSALKFTQLGLRLTAFDNHPFISTTAMAHSKWTYVKSFELDDTLLPNCWIVARLDGRGFHKLAKKHKWKRPNDIRALNLMTHAAKMVLKDFNPIMLAYGQSDEYSFVFRRDAELFERRSSKLITTLVSKFSSAYVFHWNTYFPDEMLQYPPSFDGRIVLYPTDQNLRDYLCWRQADCHINNLYNTTFWSLVQEGGMTNNEAEKRLSGTLSADKNEILFSQFGINYNNEPELFRKGTVLVKRDTPMLKMSRKQYKEEQTKRRQQQSETENGANSPETEEDFSFIIELNCDIIRDQFWNEYPYLLSEAPEIKEREEKVSPSRSS